MIKVVTTLKKKVGMSTESFRAYYESHHRLIGEKYLNSFAVRYLRRYLDSLPGNDGIIEAPEFDVLLEIWFPDEATFKACSEKLSEPDVAREIEIDEDKLFERGQKRSYAVTECESEFKGEQ
ncbi:MAG: EthD domain-containing protein [Pseudomonadales bacterium]